MSDLDQFMFGGPGLYDQSSFRPPFARLECWRPPPYSLIAARPQTVETVKAPHGYRLRPVLDITVETLRQIMPRFGGYTQGKGKKAKEIKPPFEGQTICDALKALLTKAQMIDSRADVCAFIAQVAHESAQLMSWKEITAKDETKATPNTRYEPFVDDEIKTAQDEIKKVTEGITAKANELATSKPELKIKERLAEAEKLYYAENGGEEYKTKITSYRSRLRNTGQRGGLGNTDKGDGMKFLGRGPIQLTGRDNYTNAQKFLKFETSILVKPEQVAEDCTVGMETARWYWKKAKGDMSLMANKLKGYVEVGAVGEEQLVKDERNQFDAITKRVNGGLTGADDRWKYYKLAVKTLWWEKI